MLTFIFWIFSQRSAKGWRIPAIAGVCACVGLAGAPCGAQVDYLSGFEQSAGFFVGSIKGQGGWTVSIGSESVISGGGLPRRPIGSSAPAIPRLR